MAEHTSGDYNQSEMMLQKHIGNVESEAKTVAATMIQKNYRGYRARRQIKGFGMDSATRWDDALKEARYRNRTRPVSRKSQSAHSQSHAKAKWKLATEVAKRAGNEDLSDTSGEEGMDEEELTTYRKRKAEARTEMETHAKMMDLQYWLEMVDTKHRYGSNLRAYHVEWKKQPTNENFFYWIDHGEGRNLSLPNVSRQRLDSEQVRYLSREERQRYLVRVDTEGRLCWAKNGERISTTADYRDSVEGIVPRESSAPVWTSHYTRRTSRLKDVRPDTTRSSTSTSDSDSETEGQRYVNKELTEAKGLKKLAKVSPATILNQLLQKTVKPGTWIWVADTSFRLYIGIKQSGAFQHSSFLHGSRIAAAGLMKIKNGRIGKISPLSGHYRPPTRNFRVFVHSLRDAGVDMSHVSVSRSYAVLVGLEAYVHTRRKVKAGFTHAGKHKEAVLNPELAKKRAQEELDNSESAKREREHLEKQIKEEEEHVAKMSLKERVMHKLHLDDAAHSSSTMPKPSGMVNNKIRTKRD